MRNFYIINLGPDGVSAHTDDWYVEVCREKNQSYLSIRHKKTSEQIIATMICSEISGKTFYNLKVNGAKYPLLLNKANCEEVTFAFFHHLSPQKKADMNTTIEGVVQRCVQRNVLNMKEGECFTSGRIWGWINC